MQQEQQQQQEQEEDPQEDQEDQEAWQVLRELEQLQDPFQDTPRALFTQHTSPAPFVSPLQHKHSVYTSLVQTPLSFLKKHAPSDPPTTDPLALDDLLGLMSDPLSAAHTPFFSKYRKLSNHWDPRSPALEPSGSRDSRPWEPGRQGDYSKAPSDAPFVMAKTCAGHYLYFPQRASSLILNASSRSNVTRPGKLLQTSIYQLMDQLHQENKIKLHQENKIKALVPLHSLETVMELDPIHAKEVLWVDKYRPKMYIDLTGEEKINRAVLAWVKQWDYCVFNKSVKKKPKTSVDRKFGNKNPHQPWKDKEIEENDPLQRPAQKILLITGPPGLGKTTLAHVIAQHAGYNVVEINASDDRTGESLRNKLLGAIETKESMINKKPNLVIIDEIDGASMAGTGDQNFMKFLIERVTPTAEGNVKKGKKAKSNRGLLRPIICICNDQYAPVLRPLRAVAQIFVIRPPRPRDLAKRLQDICVWEGLKADLRVTMALIDLVEGDIRSAINTLQFLKSKNITLTPEIISQSCVGHKDMQKGLFQIWTHIFELPSGKEKKKRVLQSTEAETSTFKEDGGRSFVHIQAMIQANGEFDKLIQGVYENYLKCKITDIGTTGRIVKAKIEQACNWLRFYDDLDHLVNTRQCHEFMGYMGYPIVKFHQLFASPNVKFRVEYPRWGYQQFMDTKTNMQVVTSFLSGFNAATQKTWSRRTVPTELIPFLSLIIAPEMKSMNIQLIKPEEKKKLDSVVHTLVDFGLKLVQEKGEDGVYAYRLEPPIENLVESFTTRSKGHRSIQTLPYPVQQLISQEVGREYLYRVEASKKISIEKNKRAIQTPSSTKISKTPLSLFSPLQSSQQKMSPMIVEKILEKVKKVEEKPQKDFFGRAIVKKEVVIGQENEDTARQPAKHTVLYKFNEGFSNAVRKPVLIKDLL